MSIKVSQRRAVFALLKPYCHFAKDDDYIEVTEWTNGEGVDIEISRSSGYGKIISLTHGEWELIQVLVNYRGEG